MRPSPAAVPRPAPMRIEKSRTVKRNWQKRQNAGRKLSSQEYRRLEREANARERANDIKKREAKKKAEQKKREEKARKEKEARKARGEKEPGICRIGASQPTFTQFFGVGKKKAAQAPATPEPIAEESGYNSCDSDGEASDVVDAANPCPPEAQGDIEIYEDHDASDHGRAAEIFGGTPASSCTLSQSSPAPRRTAADEPIRSQSLPLFSGNQTTRSPHYNKEIRSDVWEELFESEPAIQAIMSNIVPPKNFMPTKDPSASSSSVQGEYSPATPARAVDWTKTEQEIIDETIAQICTQDLECDMENEDPSTPSNELTPNRGSPVCSGSKKRSRSEAFDEEEDERVKTPKAKQAKRSPLGELPVPLVTEFPSDDLQVIPPSNQEEVAAVIPLPPDGNGLSCMRKSPLKARIQPSTPRARQFPDVKATTPSLLTIAPRGPSHDTAPARDEFGWGDCSDGFDKELVGIVDELEKSTSTAALFAALPEAEDPFKGFGLSTQELSEIDLQW